MMPPKIIFLDTETTGFGKCRLVELAYLVDDGVHELVSFRVKPPIPMHEGAIALHGITEDMVKDLPPFDQHPQYEMIRTLLEENIIVAHNAVFDLGVLHREGIRARLCLDTKTIAKHAWPHAPTHKLQDLREWLQLEVDGEAHTASGDVLVLEALYRRAVLTVGTLRPQLYVPTL